MTTLAKDTPRAYELGTQDLNDVPIITDDIVYEGAACGFSSSRIRPLVAADVFAGFAKEQCDNDGGAAGAKDVKMIARGKVVLSVTGVTAITDVGSTVYATDDDTFTLTSSGATAIGKILRWISGTSVVVAFETPALRSI